VTGIVDTFQPVPLAVAVPAADLGDVRTGRRRSNAVLFPAAGVA
jgi:hypothetical protein